jgi:hypothetical protein
MLEYKIETHPAPSPIIWPNTLVPSSSTGGAADPMALVQGYTLVEIVIAGEVHPIGVDCERDERGAHGIGSGWQFLTIPMPLRGSVSCHSLASPRPRGR